MRTPDLIELAENCKKASELEYNARVFLNIKEREVDIAVNRVSIEAQEDGLFDGLKVAQIGQLEKELVSKNALVAMANEGVAIAEEAYVAAKIQREYYQNLIGLVKAYLYSQAGV